MNLSKTLTGKFGPQIMHSKKFGQGKVKIVFLLVSFLPVLHYETLLLSKML